MAPFNATARLAVAELAIFIALLLLTIFIAFKHGKIGMVSWHILASFCVLRIVAASLSIANRDKPLQSTAGGEGFVITTSGSIACLVLTLIGVLYEASYYIPACSRKASKIILGVLHLITTGGISVATIGGSNLGGKSTSCPQTPSNPSLEKIGYLTLVGVCGFICIHVYILLSRTRSVVTHRGHLVRLLLYSALAALPFTVIRIIHSAGYAFSPSPGRDPDCGSFGVRFGLIFLMQLAAALCLIGGGIVTKNISKVKNENVDVGGIPLAALEEDEVRLYVQDQPSRTDQAEPRMGPYRRL